MVLQDPNERTWYDAHREQILSNKTDLTKEDMELASFGFNIWPFFSTTCYQGFGEETTAFYQVYREVFEKIKYEEEQAYKNLDEVSEDYVKPPGFGDAKTGLSSVGDFYQFWSSFSSYKTFAWADEYNPSEAPNRYVRRQIDKENKKERQREKKNYIKTIKELVEYVKRRDPRYRELQEQQRVDKETKKTQQREREEKGKFEKKSNLLMKREEEMQRWKELDQDKEETEEDAG